MCGGSPLNVNSGIDVILDCVVTCRGDYTGEEMLNFTLVLPSLFFLE